MKKKFNYYSKLFLIEYTSLKSFIVHYFKLIFGLLYLDFNWNIYNHNLGKLTCKRIS